ncbi:cytochrome P450 oxidoreductase [Coccidioides immitis RS]|uniref:Cytochrome P450 oxidoreductase n=3 Tax=Coccidioides immitis TaxID=5501 RepID=J3KEI0_COCIM|nr:cytochrome P450 oxidoreductase [Coccidioides immitis RS]EAS33898.3 cytochrome P450 oxidoreductase [Coccidioides immitis RS]KMP05098.1 pisatin demethylase [Coccidioides immitis RMSCC 2394]KMU77626.1 pisatin demethylase [Coccidioides immitis RMSCC 3703]
MLGLSSMILGAFLCFIALRFLLSITSALFSRNRSIPGPFLARFTRFWYLREIHRGHFEKVNIELHRRHGKIVRIAPNEYSVDDPEAVRTVYGPGSKFRKADWYAGWAHPDPSRFTLFTDRNSKRHAAERRKVSAAYSLSTLVSYEGFVDDCVGIFDQRLRGFADQKLGINFGHWLQCFAFDVIGEITFSKRFGFLDAGEDVGEIMESINNKMAYSTMVGVYPKIHPPLFRLLSFFRGSKATGEEYNVRFALDNISERKTRFTTVPSNGPTDFLTKFLEAHSADPEKFTNYNILMGCLTNIVAGSDTTSISLSSIMYNLCRNYDALAKLRSEIDTMTAEGRLSNPVTFKETQNMPYLQAVIKEGLRMHPATGLPLARVVPDGGVTLTGRYFEAGTVVGINSWVAHMNTSVFGADAHLFRPDRWLTTDTAQLSKMDHYFLPFGLGSRTCLGKNISLLEMSKLVPQLVRNFDFELVNPEKELATRNMWFVKQMDFFCRVSSRAT